MTTQRKRAQSIPVNPLPFHGMGQEGADVYIDSGQFFNTKAVIDSLVPLFMSVVVCSLSTVQGKLPLNQSLQCPMKQMTMSLSLSP